MSAPEETALGPGGARVLLVLVGVAAVAGIGAGAVGGTFRWLLAQADLLRAQISTWAHETPAGWVVPVLLTALAASAAAAIVRIAPRAAGSGIQDVEAVVRSEEPPPPLAVLPARYIGGLLSIGGGLVLGREGPTVHMAAALGAAGAKAARLSDADVRVTQTSLAGAGLAVAFNAPIGGALFVFEEVAKTIRVRTAVSTLVAVGVAVATARWIIGDRLDFHLAAEPELPLHVLPVVVVFAAVVAALGAAYNTVVLGSLELAARLDRIPVTVRAATIGALVGGALFLDPLTVGGGDQVSQLLLAGHTIALPLLLLYIVIRFVAGPLSYAAGTPGGLFAPLLALGALMGVAASVPVLAIEPQLGSSFTIGMAIVGMSTLFTAVVRAPLTGVVLVIEMTAAAGATLAMIVAAATATIVTTLLKSPPVYDSLRQLMLDGKP